MYNPITIANYFLHKYGADYHITPMKLVKLVYIAHGWHLGITDSALIDENPEAWKYGPVVPRIYYKFKEFGKTPIKTGKKNSTADIDIDLPKEKREFLDKIWEVYGRFTAIQLSEKTHQPGTPWYIIWHLNNRKGEFGAFQIPDNLIRDYYKRMLEINKQTANV